MLINITRFHRKIQCITFILFEFVIINDCTRNIKLYSTKFKHIFTVGVRIQ